MAKKKKNKSQKLTSMSPVRFMREKSRTLPIGECYITPNWKENGISQIIVTRIRPSGNLAVGIFLVDTFCIGVKDATYYTNMSESEFSDMIQRYESGPGLEKILYDEAHNIIYGAIGYAEDAGIKPAKDFKIAQYILEEDTENIPLIEYEYGKNGKHFLVINKDRREMPYLHKLKMTLVNDFDYIMVENEEEDEKENFGNFTPEDLELTMDNWTKMMEESNRHPAEVYSYDYPEYPKELTVKNQFIADELMSPKNYDNLPDSVINQILELPHDEAAEDISRIVKYEIGRTYESINDNTVVDPENSVILHALCLLTQLKSEKGLDAVLEIMRQNADFADYHLGDLAPDLIHPALYACGLNNVPAIESYLNQPGLDSYIRGQAFDALAMIVFLHPERRGEIIDVFRKLLSLWITRLPKQEACDGSLIGFLMSTLMDLEAKELVPEIEAVFGTDCVDKSIAGDRDIVIKEIQNGCRYKDKDKYKFPDIYEQYSRFRSQLN